LTGGDPGGEVGVGDQHEPREVPQGAAGTNRPATAEAVAGSGPRKCWGSATGLSGARQNGDDYRRHDDGEQEVTPYPVELVHDYLPKLRECYAAPPCAAGRAPQGCRRPVSGLCRKWCTADTAGGEVGRRACG